MNLFVFVFMVAMLGVMYAAYNFHKVLNMKEGTKQMVEIAAAIRVGANTFLYKEYRILIFVVTALSLVFGSFIQWSSMVAFIIGVFVSALAGFVGMKAATFANVRVTNTARKTKNIGKTLKVALRGGAVMGISVSAFALIGLVFVFALFREQLYNLG